VDVVVLCCYDFIVCFGDWGLLGLEVLCVVLVRYRFLLWFSVCWDGGDDVMVC